MTSASSSHDLLVALERALGLAPADAAGDDLDARARRVSEAVARLAERCRSGDEALARTGERLDEMLFVVTSMTACDYTKKVTLREDDDWIINALAIGLNMLGDELARSTEELTRARDRALAANRAKSTFLANMSHELRTPLNVIIGYSELIREQLADGDEGAARQDLGRIEVAAHHLLNLIKDTLDLSKIEAGRMELALEEIDLAELLRAMAVTIGPMAAARGNKVEVEIAAALPTIVADRLKVQQILYNLLSNATKFTSHGEIRLIAALVPDGQAVSVAVEDTGIGIPGDKLGLIFGAFTQADERTAASYGGTGLGLTISRYLAEMMGGELTVESTVGVGSRFTIRLPVERGAERLRRDTGRPPSNAVIMADRDPRAHDLVRRVAARHGLAVLSAASHFELLNLVAVVRPAFVVVDLGAPGVDGWSLLAALRSMDEPVPVVVTSEHDERERALSLGAADLVRRPLDARRVTEVVVRHRQGLALGAVALLAADPRAHARYRFLLEGAGWRVSGMDEDVDAIVVDARGLRGALSVAIEALHRPRAPVLVLAGGGASDEGLKRDHAVVDVDECPFEDALAALSQLVHQRV